MKDLGLVLTAAAILERTKDSCRHEVVIHLRTRPAKQPPSKHDPRLFRV
jgi:hypothetical protein